MKSRGTFAIWFIYCFNSRAVCTAVQEEPLRLNVFSLGCRMDPGRGNIEPAEPVKREWKLKFITNSNEGEIQFTQEKP